MKKITTLIIDDEKEAREGVRMLVERSEDNDILGLCKNGLEAIQQIDKLKPDLIFLDIQMPEINGFDVLNSISPEHLPLVVFVTAYDQYALKAFELHAVDYLLKPFSDERFFKALHYANQQIRQVTGKPLDSRLNSLLTSYLNERGSGEEDALIHEPKSKLAHLTNRLVIKSSGKILFLSLDEVIWIEAYDYYVKVHIKGKYYLLRESMKNMESRLPGEQFVRIHKSSIININYLKELEPSFNGEYAVHLTTGEKLKLSRSYREKLI